MDARCFARTAALAAAPMLAVALTACATLDGAPRAASSFAGCVRAAVANMDFGEASSDKREHCIAAALIAQRCSLFEAATASYAKELRDLFGRGNAEAADLRAANTGMRCARMRATDDELVTCCRASGY